MPRASRRVAYERGAASSRAENREIWDLSKRELVEIALHLAAQTTGEYDSAIAGRAAWLRVLEERNILQSNGLI